MGKGVAPLIPQSPYLPSFLPAVKTGKASKPAPPLKAVVPKSAKVVVRSRRGAGGVAMPTIVSPEVRNATPTENAQIAARAKAMPYGNPNSPAWSPADAAWARREARVNERNSAELAAIVNPYSPQNLSFEVNTLESMVTPQSLLDIVHGRTPSASSLGSDALFFLPGSRLLRGAAEGLKAARVAEDASRIVTGAKAAKESFQAGDGVVAPLSRIGAGKAARLAKKLAIRGAPRSEEDAVQHVLDTAAKAKQQGFGRTLPKVPEVKAGEVTAETGGEAGKIVREGLKPGTDLGPLRTEQQAARSVELGKRAVAAEAASAGKSGLDRHIAAKMALEGKLPAGEFKGFDALTPNLRDTAINHIYDHPHLQPFEKIRTADALDEAIAGKVPTPSDQKLLERAFGKEEAGGLLASIKQGGFRQTLYNILGVPRSLMASGDISAPFRQGLVVLASHPKLFFSEFRPMLKSLKSEGDFQTLMGGIHQMPTFPMMEKAGLSLTDIGETARGVANLSSREEQFVSNLAEQIPGIGHVVRASDRAYVGFLNKTRADLFNVLVHQAAAEGYHLSDKAVADIAKFVNSATGRGDIGGLASHTATMNALFFSPRLLMSRLNFLNPLYYARLSPFARKEALTAAGRLGGTLSLILYVAHLAGAKVGLDPRNADFGKIRVGNTRIDIAGGFQQALRLAAQLATGEIVSSTSGKLDPLAGGFAGRSRLDVLQQFLENKLAPVPGVVKDVLSGQQLSGQPLDFSFNPLDTNSEITGHLVPLALQDALSTGQQTHSVAAGIGGGLLSGVGVGVQSYTGLAANSPEKIQAADEKALATLQQEEAKVPVPDSVRPALDRGVKLSVRLELAKRQAAKSSQSGKITPKQSYKITLRTLLKAGMMSSAQYQAGVAAIPRMSDAELAHWEYEAWTNLGPGKLLSEFHHAYHVATGS